MKNIKMITGLIAILLCVGCFLGCEQSKAEPVETKIVSTSAKTNATTTLSELDFPDIDDPCVSVLGFERYSDYLSFVETADLPEGFIHYEMLSQFGEYSYFAVLANLAIEDINKYLYCFKDEKYIMDDGSCGELALYVDHKNEAFENTISGGNLEDMRLLDTDESGSVIQSGIQYNYISGKLRSMKWKVDGVTYTLAGDPLLSDYPIDSSGVVGKLLNVQSAQNVIASMTSVAEQ